MNLNSNGFETSLDQNLIVIENIPAIKLQELVVSVDAQKNILKNSPHTLAILSIDQWEFPYSRATAAFPLEYIKEDKFWPSVRRVDDAYGDRNLICSCTPIKIYNENLQDANVDQKKRIAEKTAEKFLKINSSMFFYDFAISSCFLFHFVNLHLNLATLLSGRTHLQYIQLYHKYP